MRFLKRALQSIKKKKKAEAAIFLSYFIVATMLITMVYNEKINMINNVNESIVTSLEGAGLAAVTLDQLEYESKNQKCVMYKDKTIESKLVTGSSSDTDISPLHDYRYNEARIIWSNLNEGQLIENYDALPLKKSYDEVNRYSTVFTNNDGIVFEEYKDKIENILLSNITNRNVIDNDINVNVGYVLTVEIYDMTLAEQIGREAYERVLYASKYFKVNEDTYAIEWEENKLNHSYSLGLVALQEEYDNVDTKTAAQLGISDAEYTIKLYEYQKAKIRFEQDYELANDSNLTRRYCFIDKNRACYYSEDDWYWDSDQNKYINAKDRIDYLVATYGDASTNPEKVYLTDAVLSWNYRSKNKTMERNLGTSELDKKSVTGESNTFVETTIKVTYSTITSDEVREKYVKIRNYIR